MILKIMLIIAETIMLIRLVKSVDKDKTINVLCNGFVLTTLALIGMNCF